MVSVAIHRAQRSLQEQGRVLSKEAFDFEVRLRLTSMYPYTGTLKWWDSAYQEIYTANLDEQDHTWEIPRRFEYVKALIDKMKDEGMQEVWKGLDRRGKAAAWPVIALWLLRESPDRFSEFLLATHSDPYPPFTMVSDCMLYIRFFHNELAQREIYRSAVQTCMGPARWPVISLSQRGARLYLMTAGFEKASEAFEELKQRESLISPTTLLCFVNVFTQAGEIDKAIECLRMVHATDAESTLINSDIVGRHCSSLLKLDSVVEEDGERNFKILPQLLKLGIKPNLIMMNIILANAFATGDSHLGLDMLKYMKDQGMKLDAYTYLELLHDAVARLDRDRVQALMHEISSNAEFKNNKHLSSKVFHAHFIFGAKELFIRAGSTGAFVEMLEMYSRSYDLTPLKDLGMIPPHYENPTTEEQREPSPPVLFIIIATYLRVQPDASSSFRLYRRFRELVEEGHPVIAPMATYPHLFNEFILPFRASGSDLRDCLSIMEDMLEPASKYITIQGAGNRIKRAKPNIWTWNTLLSVFNAARQPDAVNVIRNLMKKHNVEYDHVTWTTIIWGDVKMQDMMTAALSVQHMENAGFMPNSYTLRALRESRDPEQLQTALESLNQTSQEILEWENTVVEQEQEELLDKGLQRLAGAVRTEQAESDTEQP
jgi:hypothetical protein